MGRIAKLLDRGFIIISEPWYNEFKHEYTIYSKAGGLYAY